MKKNALETAPPEASPKAENQTNTENSEIASQARTSSEIAQAAAASQAAPSSEIAKREEPYLILRPEHNNAETLPLFEANVGPHGISALDLTRIRVPTGGGLSWEIETLDGIEQIKEVTGWIGAWRTARAFWKESFGRGGGVKPPDCTSRNGFTGVGDPGGDCSQCPYAQFGSAEAGAGQACKQMRQILLIRPGELLPTLLAVPPTSLKNATQYFLQLLGKGLPFWALETKFTLERATNAGGINYAKVRFSPGRRFTPEERAMLEPLQHKMREVLDPIIVDSKTYSQE
jgi:hypothetical protein